MNILFLFIFVYILSSVNSQEEKPIDFKDVKRQLLEYITNIKVNDSSFYEKEKTFFNKFEELIGKINEEKSTEENTKILEELRDLFREKIKEYINEEDMNNLQKAEQFLQNISEFVNNTITSLIHFPEEEEHEEREREREKEKKKEKQKQNYIYISDVKMMDAIFILLLGIFVLALGYTIYHMKVKINISNPQKENNNKKIKEKYDSGDMIIEMAEKNTKKIPILEDKMDEN